ncbi:MAG: hypothetical protein ABII18_04580 [bacterium]
MKWITRKIFYFIIAILLFQTHLVSCSGDFCEREYWGDVQFEVGDFVIREYDSDSGLLLSSSEITNDESVQSGYIYTTNPDSLFDAELDFSGYTNDSRKVSFKFSVKEKFETLDIYENVVDSENEYLTILLL